MEVSNRVDFVSVNSWGDLCGLHTLSRAVGVPRLRFGDFPGYPGSGQQDCNEQGSLLSLNRLFH